MDYVVLVGLSVLYLWRGYWVVVCCCWLFVVFGCWFWLWAVCVWLCYCDRFCLVYDYCYIVDWRFGFSVVGWLCLDVWYCVWFVDWLLCCGCLGCVVWCCWCWWFVVVIWLVVGNLLFGWVSYCVCCVGWVCWFLYSFVFWSVSVSYWVNLMYVWRLAVCFFSMVLVVVVLDVNWSNWLGLVCCWFGWDVLL